MEITRLKARISGLLWRITLLLASSLLAANFAAAQDLGSVNPEPLPPLANPNDPATPAKELFGRKTTPAALATHTIGFYSKGCIAGAKALPLDGETWQVMRQSRNRNWGHPNLVRFLERLAAQAPKTGWRGLLVGTCRSHAAARCTAGISATRWAWTPTSGSRPCRIEN